MISWPKANAGAHRGRLARWRAALGVILAWSVLPLQAQYQPQRTGRIFERNPMIGSGGLNYARPVSPLLSGNRYATGNVRYGQALRSFSPISDPTTFRGPLGSAALSSFRRDSVSVADRHTPLLGGRLIAEPFYDPARTVPTAGFLTGQGRFGQRRTGILPYQTLGATGLATSIGEPLDLRLKAAEPLETRITGAAPPPYRPEASTIFGVQRLREPLAGSGEYLPSLQGWLAEQQPDEWVDPLAERADDSTPAFARPLGFGQPLRTGSESLNTSLEMVLDADATRLLAADRPVVPFGAERERRVTAGQPALGPQQTGAGAGAASERTGPPVVAPELPTPSILPGNDVFTDMQLALALQRNPAANWFTEMQAGIRQSGTPTPELQEFAALQADEFVGKVVDQPIRTFVGQSASALNDELLKAESLMDIGQYYDAATRYESAHLIDPLNPLPLIGNGHALLAAGEYLSAAVQLVLGLERFPELARFSVDLGALIGGGEIIDIRRADIMKRLAVREDMRLRFLLGYVEYHSGNRQSGMEHLEQAAAQAEAGSMIRRYPAMLRGGALPPPKLPPNVPLVPDPEREGGSAADAEK